VVDHLNKVVAQAVEPKKGPPRISIGSVVGGLSAQKQKRIVERGCDILVATPGRLWDLMKSVSQPLNGVRRYLPNRMKSYPLVSVQCAFCVLTKRIG
jgi:ATP-dependent RNA helicase DDX24/MAK5